MLQEILRQRLSTRRQISKRLRLLYCRNSVYNLEGAIHPPSA
jgi:hypothetical protein